MGRRRTCSGQGRPGVLTSIGDMYGDPFVDAWPGFDPAHIGYVFTLRLRPGETRALVTFVVKGLSEVYDPRGGYPIPFKDALVTGEAVYAGADARIPAAGSEITRVTEIAAQLVKAPDLRGLSRLQTVADCQLGLCRRTSDTATSSNSRSRSSKRASPNCRRR